MRRSSAFLLASLALAGCSPSSGLAPADLPEIPAVTLPAEAAFGAKTAYVETRFTAAPAVAADFKVTEAANLKDMEAAYGFTLSPAELAFLQENKFVMKPLVETSIQPSFPDGVLAERGREFLGLYYGVHGTRDYKERGQQNALFLSSDLFLHSYNLLYVELLKEMENETFFPAMRDVSATFYTQAAAKAGASSGKEKAKWIKVRNYFAVPYALLSTTRAPLTKDDYYDEKTGMKDPEQVLADFAAEDKKADAREAAEAFVKGLALDAESERAVLADIASLYKAEGNGMPEVFKEEYEAYKADTGVAFKVDYTQFTPRSHYTGNSQRRQYFRAMTWYIQLPFFLKSPELTDYAFAASQLMAENPELLERYAVIERAIAFLVGTSDDLMPVDYLQALQAAKGKPDAEAAVTEFLLQARAPRIKALPAGYSAVGEEDSAEVLALTKGMRFFSGKFIIDSYWTGQLTQGDEAPRPGYTQKLPPMASSLEVMALLGSDYARGKIPTLDFYKPETKEAVDKAMADLTSETQALGEDYWRSNLYNGWLWTVKSLFSWQKEHAATMPRFMQSQPWQIKTLMTASGFWTELRHATLLYAKQSFAELGAGGGCDPRKVPAPPKGYIEPQVQAYDRLVYLAERTDAGLRELGFADLQNLEPLAAYVDAVKTARGYAVKELENAALTETVNELRGPDPYEEGKECVEYQIADGSDWEAIRTGIIGKLAAALPAPTDGPVLSAKDKRAAIIADVHTGGDSANPHRVLYEGVGVPHLILVAVKDANGPRITAGFTYAHYEFTEPYGGPRLTDEDWQKKFYVGDDAYDPFVYTPAAARPAVNPWYAPLFPGR